MESEIQCDVHNNPPIIPILSRIIQIPRIDIYLFKIHSILSSDLRLDLPRSFFPVGLFDNIFKTLIPFFRSGYMTAHLNLLDLINVTILGEQCKLCSSSLCSILHSSFSFPLDPNIRFKILFLNILSLRSSFRKRSKRLKYLD